MVAHDHGNIWSLAEPARSLAISEPTARPYLDLLTGAYMVRQLQPWHENLKKRQVKAPKVYLRDSGLLHQLLGIRSMRDLLSHPKCGASWEGHVIEEILKAVEVDGAYFWATHQGAELDLLLIRGGRCFGVEIKRSDAPSITASMRIAMEDLRLDHLTVVYPGARPYTLGPRTSVMPAAAIATHAPSLLRAPAGPQIKSMPVASATRTSGEPSSSARSTSARVRTKRSTGQGSGASASSSAGTRSRGSV
jgi:predicted AAA+ superfamily ATPase